MIDKLRYERKYLVPNYALDDLRKRFSSFVKSDFFAKKESNEICQYVVRSIYYDGPQLHCYYEKEDGIKNRNKLRIRGYNNYDIGNKVFLEIKRKFENRIGKNRALTNFDTLTELLKTGEIEKFVPLSRRFPNGREDAQRFFYHLTKYQLKPLLLVVYEREPYQGIFDPGVRITFDKNIRVKLYPRLDELYTNDDLKLIHEKYFVLEVKYFEGDMPRWAKSIIEEFALIHEAISKYATGIEVCNGGIRNKYTPVSYYICNQNNVDVKTNVEELY